MPIIMSGVKDVYENKTAVESVAKISADGIKERRKKQHLTDKE